MFKFLRRLSPHKWHVIGHAPVDAGCMLVIDPCYLRDVIFEGDDRVEDWYEKTVVGSADQAGEHWAVTAPENNNRPVGTSLGHIVATAGDGYFPVEVRYGPDGNVVELRIRFCDE